MLAREYRRRLTMDSVWVLRAGSDRVALAVRAGIRLAVARALQRMVCPLLAVALRVAVQGVRAEVLPAVVVGVAVAADVAAVAAGVAVAVVAAGRPIAMCSSAIGSIAAAARRFKAVFLQPSATRC